MSALGQKQTCAAQQVMSALHLIATAKAKFHHRPCLLYSKKQTSCLLWAKSGQADMQPWPTMECRIKSINLHFHDDMQGGNHDNHSHELCARALLNGGSRARCRARIRSIAKDRHGRDDGAVI